MVIDDELRKAIQDEVQQALGKGDMPGGGGMATAQTTAVAKPPIVRICFQGPVEITMSLKIVEGFHPGVSEAGEIGTGGTGGERAPRMRFNELAG